MKKNIVQIRKWMLCGIILVICSVLGYHYAFLQTKYTFSAWETAYTLVLDAGHGGFDGGAIGINGTTEQHINLRIAQQIQIMAGFFGIPMVMTRSDEQALEYQAGRSVRENKVADIKERARITEETENPVFISIHLNKYPDPQYWGAQTFYSKNNPESKRFAQAVQNCLLTGLQNGNDRKEKQAVDTIYLMKRLQCPAMIVECGFLSNPAEEQKLQEETYQTQIAVCILTGYLQSIQETARENI